MEQVRREARLLFLRLLRVFAAGVQFIGQNTKRRQRANIRKYGRLSAHRAALVFWNLQSICNAFL